jgi:hypothetical protein
MRLCQDGCDPTIARVRCGAHIMAVTRHDCAHHDMSHACRTGCADTAMPHAQQEQCPSVLLSLMQHRRSLGRAAPCVLHTMERQRRGRLVLQEGEE